MKRAIDQEKWEKCARNTEKDTIYFASDTKGETPTEVTARSIGNTTLKDFITMFPNGTQKCPWIRIIFPYKAALLSEELDSQAEENQQYAPDRRLPKAERSKKVKQEPSVKQEAHEAQSAIKVSVLVCSFIASPNQSSGKSLARKKGLTAGREELPECHLTHHQVTEMA
jgi:hypothetical protein